MKNILVLIALTFGTLLNTYCQDFSLLSSTNILKGIVKVSGSSDQKITIRKKARFQRIVQKKIYFLTLRSNEKVRKLYGCIGKTISCNRMTFEEKMSEIENLELQLDKIWLDHKKNLQIILSAKSSLLGFKISHGRGIKKMSRGLTI